MNLTVAIEGLDGAGKHTSSLYVQKALLDAGIDVASGSFPRYGQSKQSFYLSSYIKGEFGEPSQIHPFLAGKLFIDERVECLEWLKCKKGSSQILLLDRYSPSNIAYQAAKGKTREDQINIGNALFHMEHGENDVPVADLVIYLKWPVESCVKRLKSRAASQNRPIDAIEKDVAYLEAVAKIYEDETYWNEVYSGKYMIVECNDDGRDLSVKEIGDELTEIVLEEYKNYV